MKRVLFLAALATALIAGCTKDTGKTIVISWQHSKNEVCLGCKTPGLSEEALHLAAQTLGKELSDRGFKVKLVEKPADPNAPAGKSEVWVCDVPVTQWLGAQVMQTNCCDKGVHRSFNVDGRVYEAMPAELVVRAGFSAAEMISEHGKIDATKILPTRCQGCPNAGGCPGAAKK